MAECGPRCIRSSITSAAMAMCVSLYCTVMASALQEVWTVCGLSKFRLSPFFRHRFLYSYLHTVVRENVLGQLLERDVDAARRGMMFRELIERFQAAISSLEVCERPVIGVSHGYVIGLGIDILSAVDIRYTSQDARFSIREAAIGLAADIGTLQRLPKAVGNDSLARELALTARDFDAAEAKELGFVSKVFPSQQEALRTYRTTSVQEES